MGVLNPSDGAKADEKPILHFVQDDKAVLRNATLSSAVLYRARPAVISVQAQFSLWKCEGEAGANNVEHGYGHQVLPAVAHELVVTEAGQRAAHPDKKKKEEKTLAINQKSAGGPEG